jgi:lysyl-tRNA synthetase, class I
VRYFNDEVKPTKTFRAPTDKERTALADLADQLAGKETLEAKELQDIVYAVGNAHTFDPLRDWFGAIYQVLLGADQGPRFGSFIALYGVEETRKLIADALAGKLVKDPA